MPRRDTSSLKTSATVRESATQHLQHLLLGKEIFALLHIRDDGVTPGFPASGAHLKGRGGHELLSGAIDQRLNFEFNLNNAGIKYMFKEPRGRG